MLIGLTGKSCAGKNHVAALLEARGLPVLDVDKLGYQALEMEKEKIFSIFGSDLQRADGSLNRRLLGQRVFGNPEKLAALEAVIHPPVNQLTEKWITERDGACVINAALLHRSVIFNRLDRIILVTAPLFTRLIRAKRRDKLSWKVVFNRFASQKDFYSQYLSANAEIYRVFNFGSFGAQKKLERRIDLFLEGIVKWKKK